MTSTQDLYGRVRESAPRLVAILEKWDAHEREADERAFAEAQQAAAAPAS